MSNHGGDNSLNLTTGEPTKQQNTCSSKTAQLSCPSVSPAPWCLVWEAAHTPDEAVHRHIHLTNRDPRRGGVSPVCSTSHSCNAARCCITPGYTVLYRCIRDESTPRCFKAQYVKPRGMLTAGMQPLGVTALVTPQAQVIITCSKSHSLQPANSARPGTGLAVPLPTVQQHTTDMGSRCARGRCC